MLKIKMLYLLMISLFVACTNSETNNINNIENDLKKLKSEEASINVNINKEQFYKAESKFKGGANIDEKSLKISLKDQFNGNVIISLEGDKWYSEKPYRVNFTNGYPSGNRSGSFLIGKIADIVNNVGEGYILFNGYFEINFIDKNVFILSVEGDLKSPFGDAPLKTISGKIVWKNPALKSSKLDLNTYSIPLQ